jgi:hypothetical protein
MRFMATPLSRLFAPFTVPVRIATATSRQSTVDRTVSARERVGKGRHVNTAAPLATDASDRNHGHASAIQVLPSMHFKVPASGSAVIEIVA